MRIRRRHFAILTIVLAGLIVAVSLNVLLTRPAVSRYEVSITTEGIAVVGMNFLIVVTVRDRFPPPDPSQLVFLSLDGISGIEAISGDTNDDPWASASIWNLTGLDLSTGRRFVLATIPTWGAEVIPTAMVWSPRGNVSTVRFFSPENIDLSSVFVQGSGIRRLTIEWPYEVSVSLEGVPAVGGAVRFIVTVKERLALTPSPALIFVSLEAKPTDFEVNGANSDDDPWGLPRVWNVTGLDLSAGMQFSINATATATGNRGVEARIWSPRNGWSSIPFDEWNNTNPDSIRIWGSKTVAFPIQ